MAEETATNPVEGEDTSADTLPETQEVETEGQQADDVQELDENGDPVEPDDSEEVEHEGQKYKVPKALKPLLLMQADYTKKTQAVAEERAALQAERQSMHQISQAEFQTAAHAQMIGQQIAQYQQVDWRAWHESDPFAASAAQSEYTMLKDQQQQALGNLNQLRGQRTFQQQQETAKRMEEGRAALAKDIPEWSDTHRAKLIDFAAGYGFTRSELDDIEADPRQAKILHAAFMGTKATSTAKKVQNLAAAVAVQPAASVRARSAPATGLDDRVGTAEWMRRRNAQVQKRPGR